MGLACLFSTPNSSPFLGSKCICYSSLSLDPDGRKGTREGGRTTKKESDEEKKKGEEEALVTILWGSLGNQQYVAAGSSDGVAAATGLLPVRSFRVVALTLLPKQCGTSQCLCYYKSESIMSRRIRAPFQTLTCLSIKHMDRCIYSWWTK